MKKQLMLLVSALCALCSHAELTTADNEVMPNIPGYKVIRITDPDQLRSGDKVLIRIHNGRRADQYLTVNSDNKAVGQAVSAANVEDALFDVVEAETTNTFSTTLPSPYNNYTEGSKYYKFKHGNAYLPLTGSGTDMNELTTDGNIISRLYKVTSLPQLTQTNYTCDPEENTNGFFLLNYTGNKVAYAYEYSSAVGNGIAGEFGDANSKIFYNGALNAGNNSAASTWGPRYITPFFIFYKVVPLAYVLVTDADQLEAGGNYKIIAHCNATTFGGDRILTHANNTSTWPKLTAETEAAEGAVWTFEAATNNCTAVTGHASANKAFYLKNNGRYFTKANNNTALYGAAIATYETPNQYGSTIEFVPLTSKLETEGLHTWGLHVRFSSNTSNSTLAIGINEAGVNNHGTEKTGIYTEWYGTAINGNYYTSHYLVYKEVEITDPHLPCAAHNEQADILYNSLEESKSQYPLGSGLGEYTLTGWDDMVSKKEALDAVWALPNDEFTEEAYNAAYQEFIAAHDAVTFTINPVERDRFITIESWATGYYYGLANATTTTATFINNADEAIYYFTPAGKLINTTYGRVVAANSNYLNTVIGLDHHNADLTGAADILFFQSFIIPNYNVIGRYILGWDFTTTDYGYCFATDTHTVGNGKAAKTTGLTDPRPNWTYKVSYVDELPVNITNGMGSLMCPKAVDLQGDDQAWVAVMDGSTISWTGPVKHIPAYAHAVIYSPAPVNGKTYVTVDYNEEGEYVENEHLKGHHLAMQHTGDYKPNFVLNHAAAASAEGDEEEAPAAPAGVTLQKIETEGAVTLAPHTFALYVSSPNATAETLELPFDREVNLSDVDTSISEISANEAADAAVYDLQGRCLSEPRKGTVNIINGKKIFVY